MIQQKNEHVAWPLWGVLAGALGGMAASLAMNGFQKLWSKLVPMPSGGEPSTVKVARKVSGAANTALAKDKTAAAGQLVHYAFGTALGGAYGLIVEYRPNFAKGSGALFGLGSALLFDEAAVPVAKLGKAPTKTKPITHAYSAASHLVFGLVTETIRRTARPDVRLIKDARPAPLKRRLAVGRSSTKAEFRSNDHGRPSKR